MGRLIAILFVSVVITVAAKADSIPTSVVVLHPGRDETTIRLAAELSALGYAPVLLQHPIQPLWIDQVRTILKTYRADALINATSLHERVDIWIVDTKSENMQLLVDTVNAVEDSDASTILKSVETLRAGLMRIECVDIQNPSDDEKDRKTGIAKGNDRNDALSDRPERLSLVLGPSIDYGFGKLPPAWQVLISARLRIASQLFLVLDGVAPTAPMSYENQYGSAQVWTGALMLGLGVDMRPPQKRVVPWAKFGIGPYLSRMKGYGTGDYPDGEDRTVAFTMSISTGLRVLMSDRFFLEAALHVGGCVPKPVVTIGGDQADYADPLFGGTIQFGVRLF